MISNEKGTLEEELLKSQRIKELKEVSITPFSGRTEVHKVLYLF